MQQFHYIARVLILADNRVLLAKSIGADNTFLPGGHVEFGEPAKDALIREVHEEIGFDLEVGEFLGAIEHMWPAHAKSNHEINLVFRGAIKDLTPDEGPVSRESHLRLFWVKVEALAQYNLQPVPLVKLIQEAGDMAGFWGSTLD